MNDEHTPSSDDPSTDSSTDDVGMPPVFADRVGLQLHERTVAARIFGATSSFEPVTVGRFTVLRKLGEGGMGVVFAAHDAMLDREVALKLIRTSPENTDRRTEARLAAEARAMARLAHTNVATVFEVGAHEGQIFIAMELVPGQTLRAWLTAPRPWRQVVDVLVRAGRGLAAAHAAGLVHRDFKPENVMLGPADVGVGTIVKVMDFGLAQGTAADQLSTRPHSGGRDPVRGHTTLRAGWAGTPAYMSPEQLEGGDVDARSDQFSFCVTAYEALCGRRPFVGSDLAALRRELQQLPPAAPSSTQAPRRVIDAIRRGLSRDRDARFGDMNALLRAMQHDRWATARRVALGTSAALLIAIAGFALARWDGEARCTAPDERLARVWGDDRRDALGQAFAATGLAHAEKSWSASATLVDDYVARWSSAATDACRATRTDGTQSQQALELRHACLERRIGELGRLLELLEAPDAEIVGRAPVALSSLRPVATCSDIVALRERRDATTGIDPIELARLSDVLDRGEAMLELGQPAKAQLEVKAVVDRAEATGDAFVLARALLVAGRAGADLGDAKAGAEQLARAVQESVAAGDAELLARSATALAATLFEGMDDHVRALDHLALADGALRRAGEPWAARMRWHGGRGEIFRAKGRYDEAAVAFGHALRLASDARPPRPHLVAHARSRLAHLQMLRGHPESALADLEHAVAVYEAELGPTHPACAGMHRMLSSALLAMQRWDDAERSAKVAIDRLEQVFGPRHIELVPALRNLAVTQHRTGRYAEAEATYLRARELLRAHRGVGSMQEGMLEEDLGLLYQRMGRLPEAETAVSHAAEIRREHQGPATAGLASTLHTLATIAAERGEVEQAVERVQQSLQVLERAGLPEHPVRGRGLTMLGRLSLARGDETQALAWFSQAAEHFDAIYDEPHNDLAVALFFVADLQVRTGDPEAARVTFERTLEVMESAEGSNPMIGGIARFGFARLLWEREDDRPRAVELARRAREILAPIDRKRADEVDAWLRRHPIAYHAGAPGARAKGGPRRAHRGPGRRVPTDDAAPRARDAPPH